MSLRPYCRTRLVVLNPTSTVLEAARALESNRIGTVIVLDRGEVTGIITDRDIATRVVSRELDPGATSLKEVMSTNVATLPPHAARAEAVSLMRARAIRRIPVVESGFVVGIVTLDDLLMDEVIPSEAISEIVRGQIGGGGPLSPTRHALRKTRAEATYRRLINEFRAETDLDSPQKAEELFMIGLSGLIRRLTPDEAKDLIAQLPSRLHDSLQALPPGPDKSITRKILVDAIGKAAAMELERAEDVLVAVGTMLEERVSPGQIDDVIGQLPQDMRMMFPSELPPFADTGT